MRNQATRCNQAQVELHIRRQRQLGERLIADHDRPRTLDLLVSLVCIVIVALLGV